MNFKYQKASDEDGIVHIVYETTSVSLCLKDFYRYSQRFRDGPVAMCLTCLALEEPRRP